MRPTSAAGASSSPRQPKTGGTDGHQQHQPTRRRSAKRGRSPRYVDPKLQDVEVRELKSGERKHKTTYADRQRCGDYLIDRLGRARSAEEVLGVLVQTLIAAHFADEQAAVKSHRIMFLLSSYGYHHDGQPASTQARQEIPGLIEKVARPALPERMRRRLAERHTAQGEEDEQEH